MWVGVASENQIGGDTEIGWREELLSNPYFSPRSIDHTTPGHAGGSRSDERKIITVISNIFSFFAVPEKLVKATSMDSPADHLAFTLEIATREVWGTKYILAVHTKH